ncbi:MAG: nucleotidyltransferase [Clostridiales Family XIII bacterium]|jgi:dTDP-glucose pyrophosphorylase|nr:nucleotidyltransferase [Clostridiales Family XIII bacterium]
MEKPILIVMAAGMGSRYGGLKQIDPVSDRGEIIVDFSLYDALMAGFEEVIFVIKREMEADMRALMGEGAAKHIRIKYAFQELDDLPEGFSVPEGRVKPWGTCHAVLSARRLVSGSFAVINADDFYGAHAFQLMYDCLLRAADDEKARYAMAGYRLRNTLTEYGSVARGVCKVDENGYLTGVEERLKIMWRDGGIAYTEDDETWVSVPTDATVSMNFWGFTAGFMAELEREFPAFLAGAMAENPLKAEYLLPKEVDKLIKNGRASVKVLNTDDRWYGVTYKEDKEPVIAALQSLKDSELYPAKLWR